MFPISKFPTYIARDVKFTLDSTNPGNQLKINFTLLCRNLLLLTQKLILLSSDTVLVELWLHWLLWNYRWSTIRWANYTHLVLQESEMPSLLSIWTQNYQTLSEWFTIRISPLTCHSRAWTTDINLGKCCLTSKWRTIRYVTVAARILTAQINISLTTTVNTTWHISSTSDVIDGCIHSHLYIFIEFKPAEFHHSKIKKKIKKW